MSSNKFLSVRLVSKKSDLKEGFQEIPSALVEDLEGLFGVKNEPISADSISFNSPKDFTTTQLGEFTVKWRAYCFRLALRVGDMYTGYMVDTGLVRTYKVTPFGDEWEFVSEINTPDVEYYNHAFDFAFGVAGSLCDQGEDVSPYDLRQSLLARINSLSDEELNEACGIYDTHTEVGDSISSGVYDLRRSHIPKEG